MLIVSIGEIPFP